MPTLGNIVGIIQNDEALDLTAGEEGDGCDTGLPTQYTEPADDVTEELLVFFGREFGYPMVLAA